MVAMCLETGKAQRIRISVALQTLLYFLSISEGHISNSGEKRKQAQLGLVLPAFVVAFPLWGPVDVS